MKGEASPAYSSPLGALLKFLSCVALSCAGFPLLGAFLGLLRADPQSAGAWLLGVAAVLGGLVGFSAAMLLDRAGVRPLFYHLILWTVGAAVFAAAVFLCAPSLADGLFPRLLLGLVFLFVYGVGCRFFPRSLYFEDFLWIFAVFLISALVLHFTKAEYSLTPYFWLLFGMAVILAVELNYEGVDYLTARNGHGTRRLPPRIRMHNLLLLAVFAVLVAVSVTFRHGFEEALAALWQGLVLAIRFLFRLIARLFEGDDGAEAPDAVEPGTPPSFDGGEGGGSDLLFYILGCLLIAGLLYYLITGPLRERFLALLEAIRRSLFRRRGVRLLSPDGGGLYTDREESVAGDGDLLPESGSARALRRWRRECRRFAKLPDSREKFIFGYALSREGLQLHGVELPSSATPLEILALSRETFHGADFEAVTRCINALEYSPLEPAPAIAELREALEELRKTRKSPDGTPGHKASRS